MTATRCNWRLLMQARRLHELIKLFNAETAIQRVSTDDDGCNHGI